jgi:hypothetical protein
VLATHVGGKVNQTKSNAGEGKVKKDKSVVETEK